MRKAGQEPTFFWQGLLIVLPVLVLAGVGFFSLRQDKVLAESQAKEEAQKIANERLSKVFHIFYPAAKEEPNVIWDGRDDWGIIPMLILNLSFNVTPQGEPGDPRPYIAIPTPQPLKTEQLGARQKELWQEAQERQFRDADLQRAAGSYKQFLQSAPPSNFLSHAYYALGMLSLKSQQTNSAKEYFQQALATARDERGETGIPLVQMALLRLLEMGVVDIPPGTRGASGYRHSSGVVRVNPQGVRTILPETSGETLHDQLLDSIFDCASPITPQLMTVADQLGIKSRDQRNLTWQGLWDRTQTARQLSQALCGQFKSQSATPSNPPVFPRFAWLQTEKEWLATRFDHTNMIRFFVCYPKEEIVRKIEEFLKEIPNLPAYFDLRKPLSRRYYHQAEGDLGKL